MRGFLLAGRVGEQSQCFWDEEVMVLLVVDTGYIDF